MKKPLLRYAGITFGCLLFAIGFELFIKPAGLAPGGVSGIAVIISHYFPNINSGAVMFLINLPLLIVGVAVFGGGFFLGTVWASIVTSIFVVVAELFHRTGVQHDMYMSAVVGAVFTGIGMGIVFRKQATTGGTDIIVRLIQNKTPNIRGGYIFLAVDSLIVLMSGIVFRDIENVIYSALCLAINSFVFNAVFYYRKSRINQGEK